MSIDEVMKIAAVFGPDSLRAAIEQHIAEEIARETERLRGALLTLANAADDVGVQFFDMEDPPISVAQMESATLAARAALAQPEVEPPRDEWREAVRDEWRPASEPPEDGRDVVVWCAQERRAVHGMYVRRHPPVVGLVDGWVAPDASKLTHWRDVTPPTEVA